jgi:large subunit ribosomal protein L21
MAGIVLSGGFPVYAVVKTGGRQYRVVEGRPVKLGRLAGDVGDAVELRDVLLMDDGSSVTVGAPTIDGARVLGTIAEQGRDRKIIVFRYKAKTRYRKKTGHRQHFTRVVIEDILLPGQEPKPKVAREPAPVVEETPTKGRRRRKAVEEALASASAAAPDEAEVSEADAVEMPAEAPEEEAPKTRRSRRKAE